MRRETLSIDQKFDDEYSKTLSLSILDRQLSLNQSIITCLSNRFG